MPQTDNRFATTVRSLGSPDAVRALAAEGFGPPARPRVNAHVHLPPNFSAFNTTRQALDLADAQNVRVLGASNYYDYSVYADLAALAQERGIFPLFGLEIICLIDDLVRAGTKINDPGNPGKMYLCGKGITRFEFMPPKAQALLQVIRDNDGARMQAVTDKLATVFALGGVETGLNTEAVRGRVAARHGVPPQTVFLQERHIAMAFQQTLFEKVPEGERTAALERLFGGKPKSGPDDAVGVQDEIRSQLMKSGKAAFVPDTFVDFDHAYHLILALGGIPSYPVLADGATPICPYEESPQRLVADLKARGIPAAEFIPVRNTPEVLARYVRAMREAGLFVTAGTEHNTLDLIPLAPTCLENAPIPDDVQEIFWEGACVVAAHQYLLTLGQPGFVDGEGRANADFATDEARIAAFRALGATVIARYQEVCAAGRP